MCTTRLTTHTPENLHEVIRGVEEEREGGGGGGRGRGEGGGGGGGGGR